MRDPYGLGKKAALLALGLRVPNSLTSAARAVTRYMNPDRTAMLKAAPATFLTQIAATDAANAAQITAVRNADRIATLANYLT